MLLKKQQIKILWVLIILISPFKLYAFKEDFDEKKDVVPFEENFVEDSTNNSENTQDSKKYSVEKKQDINNLIDLEQFNNKEPVHEETKLIVNPKKKLGLYDIGLGLNFSLGFTTGYATISNLSQGYNYGLGVNFFITEAILAHLSFSLSYINNSESSISFLFEKGQLTRIQKADFLGSDLAIGGSYFFNNEERLWLPYVGGSFGVSFSGFEYYLDLDHEYLKDKNDQATKYFTGEQFGLELGYIANIYSGIRLEVNHFFFLFLDVGVAYTPLKENIISNTLSQYEVKAVSEHIIIFRSMLSAGFLL